MSLALIAFCCLSLVGHAGGPEQAEIKLPAKYREWKLISVAHEAGDLNDIQAVLGNDTAFEAYRNGDVKFPDGAMIARLAYSHTPSVQNNKAFGRDQSFVAGSPTNIQIMIKDSKKFPTTGGWGYAQFSDPKARNSVDRVAAKKCFACHTAVKDDDFRFTRYAP
jgi:hypothetical protein